MLQISFDIVGFDLDGTLVDSSIELANSLNHALASGGYPEIPTGEVKSLVGMGARVMLEQALERHGDVDPAEVKRLIAVLVEHYEANLGNKCPKFDGLQDALDAMRANGVKIAVVTNKFEHLAVKLLKNIGMAGYFETIIGGDTMGKGRGKPQAYPIQEMIKRCGGGSAAFVGDAWPDFAAAKAADIPCIGVRFGFDPPSQGDHAPAMWIDHYDELLPALHSLANAG